MALARLVGEDIGLGYDRVLASRHDQRGDYELATRQVSERGIGRAGLPRQRGKVDRSESDVALREGLKSLLVAAGLGHRGGKSLGLSIQEPGRDRQLVKHTESPRGHLKGLRPDRALHQAEESLPSIFEPLGLCDARFRQFDLASLREPSGQLKKRETIWMWLCSRLPQERRGVGMESGALEQSGEAKSRRHPESDGQPVNRRHRRRDGSGAILFGPCFSGLDESVRPGCAKRRLAEISHGRLRLRASDRQTTCGCSHNGLSQAH